MGTDYSRAHAADLAANLPPESRCGVHDDPLNEWTLDACLLARIEYHLHNWNWAHTEAGRQGANPPELLIPIEKRDEADEHAPVKMTVDEMMGFVGGLVMKERGEEAGDGN